MYIRFGSKTNNEDDESPSGWVAMWQSIAWIVFILLCFAYCTRNEILQIVTK